MVMRLVWIMLGVMMFDFGVKCVLFVVSFICVYLDVIKVVIECRMNVRRNIVLILRYELFG